MMAVGTMTTVVFAAETRANNYHLQVLFTPMRSCMISSRCKPFVLSMGDLRIILVRE